MSVRDFNGEADSFPGNVMSVLLARSRAKWRNTQVVGRPLNRLDNEQAFGIFPTDWIPESSSYEFKQTPYDLPTGRPTLQTYKLHIHCSVKDTEEERGILAHSQMTNAMRSMLYTDRPLAVGLNALRVIVDGAVSETIQKRVIGRARYISSEIKSEFLFLSVIEYQIETETK